MRIGKAFILSSSGVLLLSGLLITKAQNVIGPAPAFQGNGAEVVEHPECSYFADMNKFPSPLMPGQASQSSRSRTTRDVVAKLSNYVAAGSRTKSFQDLDNLGLIDKYLYADMDAQGVIPADKTSDWEFIRRVTLDLTGRIPTPAAALSFVADTTPSKRAKLIDQLIAAPEWVDKWTMFYGDLFSNTSRNTFVVRYEPGRNAMYNWIKTSLASGKPYNQMATELIANAGDNSWNQGELNWMVYGWVIGNPQQDNIDQEAANVAESFLGISHMNCLLCHNGRGHLDALSLWGSAMTRTQAWGFSSFLSHAVSGRTAIPNAVNGQPYFWYVHDDPPKIQDYTLNTTTGNRPPRQPLGTQKTMPPVYPFTGEAPASGENYRVAMARIVTSDPQFSRATVNYIWNQFFGRGIVDPVDQFDPARLDPDNPPPAPWTLQPSNARLLNDLAQQFAANGYNLKWLMSQIANSEAYQLSSRYNGVWNDAWEPLFARKLVRRLWPEEIHDAVVQSSGMLPNNGQGYNLPNFSSFPAGSPYTGYPTYGNFMFAMQAPDVVNTPDNNGAVTHFEDAFFRGDRDLSLRRSDGSSLQALDLMNDPFITSRVDLTKAPATSLLKKSLSLPADQLINTFYLNVLSRYPTADEMKAAMQQFPTKAQTASGAENLLWVLYNKVDFVFNY
jgi:hypothetical protein